MIFAEPPPADDGAGLVGIMRADLRGRLRGTLEGVVEDWAAHWFPCSSRAQVDARALVERLPNKIAAEVVAELSRIAAGPNGADYDG